jgi:F-type H+-transporting ATPase subunit c
MILLQAAKVIGAGVAVSAIGGAGTGIGIVFGSLINAVARNPSLTNQLFGYAILGFALTEAIALFGLMMAFLLLYS